MWFLFQFSVYTAIKNMARMQARTRTEGKVTNTGLVVGGSYWQGNDHVTEGEREGGA